MSVVQRVADGLVTQLGSSLTAQHRHNHAGNDKLSFLIRDGDRPVRWAKVAADAESDEQLRTWARVAPLLERHGAPPVLEVMTVDGRTALLFPYLDAPVATRDTARTHHDPIAHLLDGLHADVELATALGPPVTTADSFRGLWVERFVGDLEIIEPEIDTKLYRYLADQVRAFEELVDELDTVVHSAVHGDPWHENVLIAPDRLWLLDWEDLALGDPAVDRAILRHDCFGADARHWPATPADKVARRALLLDAVVDVAADGVENTDPAIRTRKEAEFLAGLAAYRAEYD